MPRRPAPIWPCLLAIALGGCVQPAPAAPAVPAAAAPVAVQAGDAPAAVVPLAIVPLEVRLPDGPAVGFTITVQLDAGDEALPVLPAPVAGRAAVIAAAAPATGPDGKLALALAGVAPGTPLRVVAADGKQALEALVTARAEGFALMQAGRPGVTVDVRSTLQSRLLAPAIAAAAAVKAGPARDALIQRAQARVAAMVGQMEAQLANPATARRFADLASRTDALHGLLLATGLDATIAAFVADVAADVATTLQDPAQRAPGGLPVVARFQELGIRVEVPATGGAVSLVSARTGAAVAAGTPAAASLSAGEVKATAAAAAANAATLDDGPGAPNPGNGPPITPPGLDGAEDDEDPARVGRIRLS